MNKFKPFAESYTEVTIPLDEKVITAFEQSEQYAYLLEDFYSANANPAYDSVCLTMTVSFDFKNMETFFSINTVCRSDDGISSDGNVNIDFDPVTAEYFKNEALKYLVGNFGAMKACQIGQIAVSALNTVRAEAVAVCIRRIVSVNARAF